MIWNKSKQPADQKDAATAPKKGGAAAFAKKNWKWLVPVAIVVLAGGWWLLKPKSAKPANVDTSYTEAMPETRDVSNTLSGTGTLKPANTYSVKSLVSGKVLTGSFEEGDIVEEGTVLYTVDSSDATTKVEQAAITLQQAQRSYDKTADRQYVRAEVAGVVSSLKVNKGDEVKSGQEVAVVRDSSKMNLVLEFPAADAANFSVGQTAQVTLDGTFEVLPGTITAVTGTDALSTGNLLTRTVTLSVSNAGGLTTAQAATATINGVSSIAAANFQYQAERTLTALASGTVTAINVREGGSVNKDDIILTLSGEELTESIQSASETLRGAELSMQNMQDAMDNYGIDKPDTRFDLKLHDLSEILKNTEFSVFSGAIAGGGSVRGINAKGAADKLSRKEIDKLTDFVKTYRAKGLAYTRWTHEGRTSSFEKFLTEEEIAGIHQALDAEEGDLLLIVADAKNEVVYDALGQLRNHLAQKLGLIEPGTFDLLWVTEFPLFEYSEEEGRYMAKHHPFTCPMLEDLDMIESDPGHCRARAYDMVMNGCEVGGGSIRINTMELQERMLVALGFTPESAEERFGFLLEAFRYGAPPHGGMAFGLDRLVMLLLGKESIKDVIAFPKVQNASELMSGCPAEVEDKSLAELAIKVDLPQE